MLRRLFTLLSALSLLLCAATATLWLAHAIRSEFDLGLTFRARLGPHVTVTAGEHIDAQRYAGYGLEIERPWPRVDGPVYLTPEYMAWKKQFRRRDRVLEGSGLSCWRWAIISQAGGRPDHRTTFHGYWYGLELPYWLVCAVAAVLPFRGFVRWRRRRRRSARGGCPTCGYDLRATPGRCPECGTAAPPTPPPPAAPTRRSA
jgi:hypothetical protein